MHFQITFGVNMSEVEIFVTGKLKKRKKQKYRRMFSIKRIFLKVTVANRCVFERKKSHQKRTKRRQKKINNKKVLNTKHLEDTVAINHKYRKLTCRHLIITAIKVSNMMLYNSRLEINIVRLKQCKQVSASSVLGFFYSVQRQVTPKDYSASLKIRRNNHSLTVNPSILRHVLLYKKLLSHDIKYCQSIYSQKLPKTQKIFTVQFCTGCLIKLKKCSILCDV